MRAALLPLLLASFLPQEKEGVAALIRDLGHDSIEIRERASRKLIQHGDPALDLPERAEGETSSEEIRSRLKSVIGDIRADLRRKKFEGGNEVGGLRASLKLTREQNGSYLVSVEIMNVSSGVVPFVPMDSVETHLPSIRWNYTGSHGQIIVRQISGDRPAETCDGFG